eukprot:scaffold586_cov155-Amphora_coffeaeformis.AAC.17
MSQGNDTAPDGDNGGVVVDATAGQFLWLSDIHLDPYYGTENAAGHANCRNLSSPVYGQLGCDAPERLIRHVLEHAAAILPTPDFVVLTGDLCRHGTENLKNPVRETQAIVHNITDLIRSAWGKNISIVPSLGNNDVTPDYFLDIQHPTEILEMVTQGLEDVLETETEWSTFRLGGYLARNVADHMTVLSLNTLLYATAHSPDQSHVSDPLDQFAWLQKQLAVAQTANRKVYIAGHIPPALGSYRHSQLWHESYARRYYTILDEYDGVIAGQFFGHLHSDEFRLIRFTDETLDGNSSNRRSTDPWSLWMVPSITPIYGSNPSFRVVSYDSVSGNLLDYHTYYLNLFADDSGDTSNRNENDSATILPPQWVIGPSFQESFGLPDLSLAALESLVHNLNQSVLRDENVTDSDPLWQVLLARQHVHAEDGVGFCLDSDCRREWICTLTTFTKNDFESCTTSRKFSVRMDATSPWGRVGGIVAGGLCMVWLLWWLQRYFRRRHYQQHIDVAEGHVDKEVGDPYSKQGGQPKRDISHRESIELNGQRGDHHRPRLLRAIS